MERHEILIKVKSAADGKTVLLVEDHASIRQWASTSNTERPCTVSVFDVMRLR